VLSGSASEGILPILFVEYFVFLEYFNDAEVTEVADVSELDLRLFVS